MLIDYSPTSHKSREIPVEIAVFMNFFAHLTCLPLWHFPKTWEFRRFYRFLTNCSSYSPSFLQVYIGSIQPLQIFSSGSIHYFIFINFSSLLFMFFLNRNFLVLILPCFQFPFGWFLRIFFSHFAVFNILFFVWVISLLASFVADNNTDWQALSLRLLYQ